MNIQNTTNTLKKPSSLKIIVVFCILDTSFFVSTEKEIDYL